MPVVSALCFSPALFSGQGGSRIHGPPKGRLSQSIEANLGGKPISILGPTSF